MNKGTAQPVQEISGDGQMSISERLTYLFRNTMRNLSPKPQTIHAEPYNPDFISDDMAVASPSRALTLSFLDQQIQSILPVGNIRILDVGCGSGFISDLLANTGYKGVYTGIDIGDRFRDRFAYPESFERTFINADAHTFTSTALYDLIFSFSALEHIPNDAQLIQHLSSVLKNGGNHLHIVPGGWGLPLYLWHGFRQYSLGDIENRFGAKNLKVYALGGLFSFLLHFTFITVLEMLLRLPARKWFRRFYMLLHRACLRLDRIAPIAPAAYVVCKTNVLEKNRLQNRQLR